MSNISIDNLITIDQYMELYNVTRATVYNRIEAGKIEFIDLGGKRFIDKSTLTEKEKQHKKPKKS
jgi:excisionase family DNA binding protein